MNYLQVTDWALWQTYRKDRGTPPWIKIHRQLMTSTKWAALTDADKGALVSIWIAAADKSGRVPANPSVLKKICMLDNEPDLNKFIDLGYLTPDGCHDDATMTPTCRHDDAPETETETETETEKPRAGKRARKPKKTGSRLPADWKPSQKLLTWAMTERADLDMQKVIDSFTDYWIAKTGAAATKLDWDATFRNWVRNEKSNRNLRSGNRAGESAVQRRAREQREALERLS